MTFRVLITNMGLRLARIAGAVLLLCVALPALAQQDHPAAPATAPDYSGMYSFRKEGEFIQINLEEGGRGTGFVSRYGDSDSDRGTFLDQFFKTATLTGSDLQFTTQTVHNVWFDFKGTFLRGTGKNPGDEAYFVLKGTLTESSTGADKKASTKSQAVEFKAFPRDLDSSH